jgi:hypothetical protein
MWELVFEIDYHTVRSAIWAGCFLALMLPLASFYLFNSEKSFSYQKNTATIDNQPCKHIRNYFFLLEWNGIIGFLSFIRRKESPDDSDAPFLLSVL